jgi:hypothetical protein
MNPTYIIKVLVNSFPGYNPILDWYNANKPEGWSPIKEAGIREGGFEVPLTATELNKYKERNINRPLDANEYVRQLEWRRGELVQHHNYAPLYEKEKLLIGKALAAVLGADKVEITQIL